MAFGHWQIGLHIQQDSALSVALSSGRSGRALRRWWHIPLPAGTVDNGRLKAPQQLFSALQPWRDALPQRHQVRLAFPAARTLQKKLPRPAMYLREKALTTWLSHAVARELEMSTDDLRFDYAEDSLEQAWSVTAAQRKEVADLLEMAKNLRLNLAAITPDACALQRFIPFLTPPAACIAWQDEAQWLWATQYGWGRRAREEVPAPCDLAATLGLAEAQITLCSDAANGFDPWGTLARLQPPLPENGDRYAIAIALALGERP